MTDRAMISFTNKTASAIAAEILQGNPAPNVDYDSITIEQTAGGHILISFILDRETVGFLKHDMPNFTAGEVLKIDGIGGSLKTEIHHE